MLRQYALRQYAPRHKAAVEHPPATLPAPWQRCKEGYSCQLDDGTRVALFQRRNGRGGVWYWSAVGGQSGRYSQPYATFVSAFDAANAFVQSYRPNVEP